MDIGASFTRVNSRHKNFKSRSWTCLEPRKKRHMLCTSANAPAAGQPRIRNEGVWAAEARPAAGKPMNAAHEARTKTSSRIAGRELARLHAPPSHFGNAPNPAEILETPHGHGAVPV